MTETTLAVDAAKARDPHPVLDSPLNLGALLLVMFGVHLWLNQYTCFRTDHLTQIPLLMKRDDPTLFMRDWFMTTYGHFELRRFHLMLLEAGRALVGLAQGILLFYALAIAGTFAAWIALARRFTGSTMAGLAVIALAIFVRDREIGSNHLIEEALIPRAEGFVLAWWSFVLLVREGRRASWGLAAGVLMATAGYFQPAVAIQFALPLTLWVLFDRRYCTLPRLGLFLLALLAPMVLRLSRMAGGFSEATTLSDTEQIQLAAWLRHPHHMIPHLWKENWVVFAGLAVLFIVLWRRYRHEPGVSALGRLAAVLAGILALCAFFIEVVPVKSVILFQPFRMAVMLYGVMFIVIGRHVAGLLASPSHVDRFRAGVTMLGPIGWPLMLPLGPAEGFLAWREGRGRPLAPKWKLAVIAVPLLVAGVLEDALEEVALVVIAGLLAVAALRGWVYPRPRVLTGGLAALVAAGVLAICSFWWMPLERWMAEEDGPRREWAGELAYHYQFNPVPIRAIERIAAWAGEHTQKDDMFIIPPGRSKEGFRLWSGRSVFFNVKFFPYKPSGYEEWTRRYLAVRGILEPEAPENRAAVEAAMNDIGTETVDDAYGAIDAPTMTALARREGAQYVVTPARYDTPDLEMVHTDFDRDRKDPERGRMFLYRVRAGGDPATAAQ